MEERDIMEYIPCDCGGRHGLLLTYDTEDDQVYISLMDGMFSGRNIISQRIYMAWRVLRGAKFDDFVITPYEDLRNAVKNLKHREV